MRFENGTAAFDSRLETRKGTTDVPDPKRRLSSQWNHLIPTSTSADELRL
jgi:hypothetical protein